LRFITEKNYNIGRCFDSFVEFEIFDFISIEDELDWFEIVVVEPDETVLNDELDIVRFDD